MKIKKRIAAAVLFFTAVAALAGCASILDGETYIVTVHEKPVATTSESVIEANSYDELKTQVIGFIKERTETGIIRVNSYDGDIDDDVNRVCIEITNDDPYGAYAVLSMTGTATPVVSYYEVVFKIDYNSNVTKKQIDSIIPISTLRYLKSTLQDKLAGYAPSMTILTKSISLTEDDAVAMVREIYYEHPMEIVMMPITSVHFYPDHGPDRITEFTFGYSRYEAGTLRVMAEALENKVRNTAESVTGGSNDGAILLSLGQKLTGITDYDTQVAESGDYSTQNIAATAYGALIDGMAVGEGYAMAYKSLCDELGIECYVVLGEYNDMTHAWNIVALEGAYYHVDISMCDVNGMETAFLKNDDEMKKDYIWDIGSYKVCDGPLSYASLTKTEPEPANSDTSEPTTSEIPEPTASEPPEPTASETSEPTAEKSPEPTT